MQYSINVPYNFLFIQIKRIRFRITAEHGLGYFLSKKLSRSTTYTMVVVKIVLMIDYHLLMISFHIIFYTDLEIESDWS